jgi:hypothetical protein
MEKIYGIFFWCGVAGLISRMWGSMTVRIDNVCSIFSVEELF